MHILMGVCPTQPPREGGALSTGGFLSFQLLGPPSFVYFRGSSLSRPGGVGWGGESGPGLEGRRGERHRGWPLGPTLRLCQSPWPGVVLSGTCRSAAPPGRASEGPTGWQHLEGSAQALAGVGWGRHCSGGLDGLEEGHPAPLPLSSRQRDLSPAHHPLGYKTLPVSM